MSMKPYKSNPSQTYPFDPATGKRLTRSGFAVNPTEPMTQEEVDEQCARVDEYLQATPEERNRGVRAAHEVYIATVQLAVVVPYEEANPQAFACDAISETLPRFRESEVADWQYLCVGAQRMEPQRAGVVLNLEDLEENELFNV
jgi:hypothetical protein